MADAEEYEALVLGSGEAGKWTAWTMADNGHRTVMVERKWLGGSCPNIACLPSKNVIYSARVASLARRGAEFGLEMDKLRINMAGVQRRKREMVEAEHQFHAKRTTDAGIELLMGEGRFVAPKTVERRPPALSHRRDEAKRGPAVSTDSCRSGRDSNCRSSFGLLTRGRGRFHARFRRLLFFKDSPGRAITQRGCEVAISLFQGDDKL